MITGQIVRQHLKLNDTHVVADTIDYLEAKFVFRTDDWDGLEKWAHFAGSDGTVYDVRLTDDCIRKEDHLNLSAGTWNVYLHGNEFADGKVLQRITTNSEILCVEPAGILNGEPFPTVLPSAGEQIIAEAQAAETGAKEAAAEAGRTASAVQETIKTAEEDLQKMIESAEQTVEDTLNAAMESGEFDGKDGVSVTVAQVMESDEDGGSNVVIFSDGKTLTVRNGRAGAKGDPGADYVLTAADKREIAGMIPGGGSGSGGPAGMVLLNIAGTGDILGVEEMITIPEDLEEDAALELVKAGSVRAMVMKYNSDFVPEGVGIFEVMQVNSSGDNIMITFIGTLTTENGVQVAGCMMDWNSRQAQMMPIFQYPGGAMME